MLASVTWGLLAGTLRVERQGELVEGKLDIGRKGTKMSLHADPWQSLRPQSLTSRAGDRRSSTHRSLWISPWLPSLLFCGWGLFRPCQLSSRTRILAVPGRDPWDPSQAGSIQVQPVKRSRGPSLLYKILVHNNGPQSHDINSDLPSASHFPA
jgi:hypothetical protein